MTEHIGHTKDCENPRCRGNCADVGLSAVDVLVTQHEGYPEGWARVTLMVSPDGKQMHAIGGDREPGEGDTAYIGLERIRKASAG